MSAPEVRLYMLDKSSNMKAMITVKGRFQRDPYIRDQMSGGERVMVRDLAGGAYVFRSAVTGRALRQGIAIDMGQAVTAAGAIKALSHVIVKAPAQETPETAKAKRQARMKAISRLLTETHRDTLAELAK